MTASVCQWLPPRRKSPRNIDTVVGTPRFLQGGIVTVPKSSTSNRPLDFNRVLSLSKNCINALLRDKPNIASSSPPCIGPPCNCTSARMIISQWTVFCSIFQARDCFRCCACLYRGTPIHTSFFPAIVRCCKRKSPPQCHKSDLNSRSERKKTRLVHARSTAISSTPNVFLVRWFLSSSS